MLDSWQDLHEEEPPEYDVEVPTTERLRSVFRWIWERISSIWLWLVKPNQVGRPVTLQPRGLQFLILLIVGNLAIVGVLVYALYQMASAPPTQLPPQLVVATPTPAPSPAPSPMPTPLGSGGAIAFTHRRNGNVDIYALNQADQQLVRLTDDLAEDRDPAWSPDGQLLAFASNRANNWDIYLLDLVSGTPIRLTQSSGFDANPSWSPDGKYIAFESYRRSNLDIYIMSTSGGQVRRITTNNAPDYEPAWSPDSRAIAFTSFRDGNKDIFVYLVDDRQTINITNSPGVDEDYAAWSPDGTQLAYISGPHGTPSIQVTTFDWDTRAADQAKTQLLGAGTSPAWAPDGGNLIYVAYEREERSHLIAASMTGWAVSQEVYSTDGLMDDLAWTDTALSPRVIARAQATRPIASSLYMELVQPTPTSGPPYKLVPLLNIESEGEETPEPEIVEEVTETEEAIAGEGEGEGEEGKEGEGATETEEPVATKAPVVTEEPFLLSDRVDESFNALRQRVIADTGWDYLGTLSSSWVTMTFTPPSGHSRMSWHVCGRAIGLDREPYDAEQPQIELVREDVGSVTYWRIFIRAAEQDGSMGEPLRQATWDLDAREEGGRAFVEGGEFKELVPSGYYVDFTALASDYGWERVPSMWRWRYSWPDILWWELEKTDGLDWWKCMLEVLEPDEIESAYGPIPGYED